ncbi:MAG: hypothetical protein KDA61_21405, partial [Planctomycetales bacterium]|nr:hypothetical protein [Planctomycetales bacterium]
MSATLDAIERTDDERRDTAVDAVARQLSRAAEAAAHSRPLGQQLVGANLLAAEELEAALSRQAESGKRLGEVLLELGFVTEDGLLPYVETQLGVPAVRLREGLLDPIAVHLLPRRCAEQLNVLALFCVRGVVTLAMDDPGDLAKVDQIERITGLEVRPVFAFASSITRMIKRAYEDDFQVDAVTADMEDGSLEVRSDTADVDVASVHDLVEGSPVINLVNYLVLQAVRKGASDIHI